MCLSCTQIKDMLSSQAPFVCVCVSVSVSVCVCVLYLYVYLLEGGSAYTYILMMQLSRRGDSPRRTPKVRMARSFGNHSQELLELFSTVPSPRPCHRSFMIIDLAFYSCDERLARGLAFVNSKTCRRGPAGQSRKRSLVQNILKFASGGVFPQASASNSQTPKWNVRGTGF